MTVVHQLTWCFAVVLVCATVGVGCSGEGLRGVSVGSDLVDPIPCAELVNFELADTTITLAESIPAGPFTPPGSGEFEVPAFCRVAGVTSRAIEFEVWLPEEWNGKFQGVGNGGMAGRIFYNRPRFFSLSHALVRGYATAGTDAGHKTTGGSFDASWAIGRPDLVEDFGHRGLHVMTVNGKAITEAFYGTPPSYAYYTGCSKGGQQGLMEAQRYPDEYDGIIAGTPAHDWTSFYAGAHLWYAQATLSDPESYIPSDKVGLLTDAVNAACDGLDGVEDGVLNDPRDCDFDPTILACAAGDDPLTCFTAKQVVAVESIWAGGRTPNGELIYPGLVPGGEAEPGNWDRWITGSEPFDGLHYRAADGFFKHMVFEDLAWDFESFDWESDFSFALKKVGTQLDSNDPDLSAFRDRGGKLIVYHGWADPDISPLSSIDYYEAVALLLGGDEDEAGLLETADFFRLFLAPGMGHCYGGPGPDQFDALSVLEAWVERGVPPKQIIASKVEHGETVRTRPLCPYPHEAQWTGDGSTDDDANFVCAVGN